MSSMMRFMRATSAWYGAGDARSTPAALTSRYGSSAHARSRSRLALLRARLPSGCARRAARSRRSTSRTETIEARVEVGDVAHSTVYRSSIPRRPGRGRGSARGSRVDLGQLRAGERSALSTRVDLELELAEHRWRKKCRAASRARAEVEHALVVALAVFSTWSSSSPRWWSRRSRR
jgi:hypothetical protein